MASTTGTRKGVEGGIAALAVAGLTAMIGLFRHQGKRRVQAQHAELETRACQAGDDPEFHRWAADIRRSLAEGRTFAKAGKQELLEMKAALRKAQ